MTPWRRFRDGTAEQAGKMLAQKERMLLEYEKTMPAPDAARLVGLWWRGMCLNCQQDWDAHDHDTGSKCLFGAGKWRTR